MLFLWWSEYHKDSEVVRTTLQDVVPVVVRMSQGQRGSEDNSTGCCACGGEHVTVTAR